MTILARIVINAPYHIREYGRLPESIIQSSMWYIYINDLNEGVVGTIIRSADDTKLGMDITL